MGGDDGLRPVVCAAVQFLKHHPTCHLTLVGNRDQIAQLVAPHPRLQLQHAGSTVAMSDRPAQALRSKHDSSMAMAIRLVADQRANACVSAGNTGALMAFGLHHLGTLAGITRPAICKSVPNKHGCCLLLDLGANISCSAAQLAQFAVMGAAMARVAGKPRPRIGLLNIGREPQKGGSLHQAASTLVAALPGMEYVGFVEGGDIFTGEVDVVVCDGFTGNAVLKASEGAAALMRQQLKDSLSHGVMARFARLLVQPYINRWRSVYDPARYNGAVLLGLCGVVVKSHGAADASSFAAALQVAYEHGLSDTPAQIAATMHKTIQIQEHE